MLKLTKQTFFSSSHLLEYFKNIKKATLPYERIALDNIITIVDFFHYPPLCGQRIVTTPL